MVSDCCASSLIALPDDVFAVISGSLSPKDLCNLSICCRSLYNVAYSDKLWLVQCDVLGFLPLKDLLEWRRGVNSYKALYRFLVFVQPLSGLWVHQNPELGNVVYVMYGFVSLVGCRIIPQEVGALGIEDGSILWAPVFEVIGDFNGAALFLLHGREKDTDYYYPGLMKRIEKNCNVLFLEVEPRKCNGRSKVGTSFEDLSRMICRTESGIWRGRKVLASSEPPITFGRLAFGDRRKLLEMVTTYARVKAPCATETPLFPRSMDDVDLFGSDIDLLSERRSMLMKLYAIREHKSDSKVQEEHLPMSTQLEINEVKKKFDNISIHASGNGDGGHARHSKSGVLGRCFFDGFKLVIGRSYASSLSAPRVKGSSSNRLNRHVLLNKFMNSGDVVELALHASTVRLSSYRGWPNMHDSKFALYKLSMQSSTPNREYAGLWGGTFGWPRGNPTEGKPGKALFFLLLSYEELDGKKVLIATKILEGTHYVLHPNGSAMFIANIENPSLHPFPYSDGIDSVDMDLKLAFMGEGIANGYGFRYPGSKPGLLYVVHDGLLAFVWKDTGAILALQRLNLQSLIKKGGRVPALPPVANFSYLTKSYSNVYTGFSVASNCSSLSRSIPSNSHLACSSCS